MLGRRNCRSLFRRLDALRRCDRGNLAVLFSLALLPIIGFIGGAVDYSAANRSRSSMQNALDTAALYVAKDLATTTMTEGQITQAAKNVFNGMFNRPDVENVALAANYVPGTAPTLTLSGSGSVKTNFLRAVGMPSMNFSLSSTITWGNTKLRVALVLDNTGSMAQANKLNALKTATKNLLDQLNASAATNGDVYVSIVPFVKDVNVGGSNYNASWIDWTDWDNNNGTCSGGWGWGWGGGQTRATCNGTWTPASHVTWNGCVVDRGNSNGPGVGSYDTNVTAPTAGITASLYAAEQYSACPQAVMGLSYDWTGMKSLVNNMVANGNTNQAIGLQLGWMSLVGGGPFTVPPIAPNSTYKQIIILLTDGLNTQNRWYTDQASIDARQQMTCSNVKAAGITVYTVQVNTGNDPTSTLLQNCASSSSNFYLLKSADEIVTTFSTIGTQLSQLRISK